MFCFDYIALNIHFYINVTWRTYQILGSWTHLSLLKLCARFLESSNYSWSQIRTYDY
jgi:hypothetical protein